MIKKPSLFWNSGGVSGDAAESSSEGTYSENRSSVVKSLFQHSCCNLCCLKMSAAFGAPCLSVILDMSEHSAYIDSYVDLPFLLSLEV